MTKNEESGGDDSAETEIDVNDSTELEGEQDSIDSNAPDQTEQDPPPDIDEDADRSVTASTDDGSIDDSVDAEPTADEPESGDPGDPETHESESEGATGQTDEVVVAAAPPDEAAGLDSAGRGEAGEAELAASSDLPTVIAIWPFWAWSMVAVTVVVLGLSILVGVLSRTLVLDVLSFWPGLVLIVLIAAALLPRLRKGAPRLLAVIPLLLFTYLAFTVTLHVARWDQLPSTNADLYGPPQSQITDARIELETPGVLTVVPAPQDELYQVLLVNRAGDAAAPAALEVIDAPNAAIVVAQRQASDWFRSDGWDVRLSLNATWELVAAADELDVDLTPVSTSGLVLTGDGTVSVGFVRSDATVQLEGTIRLTVRAGSNVEVVGAAEVPDDWTTTDTGFRSPGAGEPFVVTVIAGSLVTIDMK